MYRPSISLQDGLSQYPDGFALNSIPDNFTNRTDYVFYNRPIINASKFYVAPINSYHSCVNNPSSIKGPLYRKTNMNRPDYYDGKEYGSTFTHSSQVEKQEPVSDSISYNYLLTKNNQGSTYFLGNNRKLTPVKASLSCTRSIVFKESILSQFSLNTNPSVGIVGIKFDKYINGKMLVSITNSPGHTIINKEIDISDSNYRQPAKLQRGIY